MNASLTFFTGLALTSSLLLVTTGCDRLDDLRPAPQGAARTGDFTSPNGSLDKALFASKIKAHLTGKVSGFGYRIWVNGKPYSEEGGGGGLARYPIDAPALAYTAQTRQEVVGGTQFVTALAVLKTLERNGKTVDEFVWSYLPSYFKPHPDFKKLRFRHLLWHTSGIITYNAPNVKNGEINSIQLSVEKEIQLGELYGNIQDNQDMNYQILRLTVPYLIANLGSPQLKSTLASFEDSHLALGTSTFGVFEGVVQLDVMKAAGIEEYTDIEFADALFPANQFTKYYPGNATGQPGHNNVPNLRDAGAVGLVISADELAQVLAKARAGQIVSSQTYQMMRTGTRKMGFDGEISGKLGTYAFKVGSSADASAIVMDFQGKPGHESAVNVQLVVTANTGVPIANNPAVWAKLFEDSWKF